MEIKQILLALTPGASGKAAIDLAARLARQNDAAVEGVCLFQEPSPEVSETFAAGPRAVTEVLERRQARIDALVAPAASEYEAAVTRAGLSEGWSVSPARDGAQPMTERARLADLVVICGPELDPDYRGLAEKMIVRSGTPCLLAPPRKDGHPHREFDRVVLAWNGSKEAKRALDDGLWFLRRAAEVSVLVAKEEATRGVDQGQVDALLRHLARHGVNADLLRTEGRAKPAGEILIEQCDSFGADLLVMGAFGHTRTAELILGGATRTMLSHARIPTLLSH